MQSDEFKLLFAGPMGAGKTTAINAISDQPCVSTDVANSDTDQCDKATTTAALDYGYIALPQGQGVRLYGTPGQTRFRFMWPILAGSAAGVILLLDGSHDQLMTHLDTYVEAFGNQGVMPMVVGVGRLSDADESQVLHEILQHLERRGESLPVLAVDVRQRDEVLMLIETLLCLIDASDHATGRAET